MSVLLAAALRLDGSLLGHLSIKEYFSVSQL
jgi:hypothetical protein